MTHLLLQTSFSNIGEEIRFPIHSTYIEVRAKSFRMHPVIFQTLPEVFSFFVVVMLLEACAILLATGRRYLKQASYVAVGVAGGAIGESAALLVLPSAAWLGIAGGVTAGTLLCYYLRPVAVGVALAYFAFLSSIYLVNIQYAQYVVATVLFTYGLLLTDLAPTFVSCLLACGILVLTGVWTGVPIALLLAMVSLIAAGRFMTGLRQHRVMGRMLRAVQPELDARG
jgi:hypothetical protein